jgi:iron-sulfur cluster assembly accessory protein
MLKEVEKQVEEQVFTISPEAAQAVLGIITEKKMDGHALRIYVAGSGCSGMQFGMALDDKFKDTDTTVVMEGVKVVVDNQSIEFMQDASIEWVDDPQRGAGFVVNAPNAQQAGSCSCGNEASAQSSCGCGNGGGGCGCGH